MGKRILMATTGSLGDLHPFLAIGLELRSRGHAVTIATSDFYQPKVERTGLKFAPMGPHMGLEMSEMMDRIMDLKNGPEYLIRKILYPSVPAAYAEAMDAIRDADLIVTHPITFAAQVAAEKTGIPWVSTVTAPLSFFSKFDPSVIASHPSLIKLRSLGPSVYGAFLSLGRLQTRFWRGPLVRFRASVGMAPGDDPLFAGQHSPQLVLALFSALLAEPQADWPPHAVVTGFPFYDQVEHEQGLDPDLERFLDAGPAPVVFTLGSSAVQHPGSFYRESLAAVRRLGCRAILLAGANLLDEPLPAGTMVVPYAPFSKVFPRASAVVHQGGVGTCGQTMAAGRPMLVVPFAFDQPDNAARLERLGVARTLQRSNYRADRVVIELQHLLNNPAYAERAGAVAIGMAKENGARTAADAIESRLG